MNDAELTIRLNNVWVNSDPRFKNRTGQVFGRLTVIRYLGQGRKRNSMWLCRCDCGKEVALESSKFVGGNTSSCGCLRREMVTTRMSDADYRKTFSYHRTHGLTQSSEHHIWCGMKGRCLNPNLPSFRNYGGRGISICDRWIISFEHFLSDMGRRPTLNHTLGRKDNNGNYTPENCRWETATQQANNKRNNSLFTLNGKTLTMAQWAKESGVKYWTLACRLRAGWPIELAIVSQRRPIIPLKFRGKIARLKHCPSQPISSQ